jgi:spermidine/putrescine transport system ATP-binding protein
MSEAVELDHVTMRFGAFTAVDDVCLTIAPGEFFSFLGPSGCGKTTILRLISGFLSPSAGQIRIGDRDMARIGANRRPTALIFQNLALFPLMPVWENIAFGLEVRGMPARERRRRAEALLDLVAMPQAADKRIHELSGGQKQRVAIARALAVEPKVMLLDEPLSALDLKLRQHMRAELREIQRRTGVTFIYITHDQSEALTMSDRLAVMSGGVIQQIGRPIEIYNAPRTRFVAGFVGETNRFGGTVVEAGRGNTVIATAAGHFIAHADRALRAGDAVELFVRPERMILEPDPSVPNRLESRLSHIEFEGSVANIFLNSSFDRPLTVQVANAGTLPDLAQDRPIAVGFRPGDGILLPAEG